MTRLEKRMTAAVPGRDVAGLKRTVRHDRTRVDAGDRVVTVQRVPRQRLGNKPGPGDCPRERRHAGAARILERPMIERAMVEDTAMVVVGGDQMAAIGRVRR